MTTEALHFNCVPCRAQADQLGPVEAVTVVLVMLDNCELEGVVDDLCFEHRKYYSEVLKRNRERLASINSTR